MKLSFCAIVKNEAESLPACLRSAIDAVDEIIVLDTGSTDDTVAVARSLGARVHHFQWCDDFAAARNESLKYAGGEWILVLDADERLVPGAISSLKQAIESEAHVSINLIRQEVGATQSPYSLVSRLFRNRPDIRFSRPYHAIVDDSIAALLQREPCWQIGSLPEIAILHEGYHPDAIAQQNKLARARAAMERFLAEHPTDPYVCSKLGALYVESGELGRGIELLQLGLKSAQNDASVLYELHYHLGIACSRLQKPAHAEDHYQQAMAQSIAPLLKIGTYNNLGNLLKAKGDLVGAKAAYETILELAPELTAARYNLGMTLRAMGDLESAIAAYRQTLQLDPNYADAHQNLGVALLKAGQLQDSLAAFRQAIALHEQHNPTEAKRLRHGLQEMGFQV